MRDALSIMDKIVSFTGGVLTYTNTLEHLNILDADYFFKLLKCMQEQDLAGSLLLYDDINKKGFEGDMLLNGFAEFIRNLLVCKDNRVASLLEVVSSFKDKYLQAAAETSTSWLISALNILNESEIGYKQARNKRLHVELALIKLSYLSQAIEITSGSGEAATKKKIADKTKAVSFRKLVPISAGQAETPKAKEPAKAKLVIETPIDQQKTVKESNPEVFKSTPSSGSSIPGTTATSGAKLSMLKNIREKFAGKQNADNESVIPLSQEKLELHWKEYADGLREQKNPAVQSFDLARLVINSDHSFEVLCHNNLEQKFIEQERIKLGEFLQKSFNNKALLYSVVIDDSTPHAEDTTERPLNTREQFQKIVEEYPLVKELKDRLRLELDY